MGKTALRFDIKSHSTRTLLAAGALVLLVLIVYLPVIHCGFVWDDDANVTENLMLRSLHGLLRTWTHLHANQQFYPLTYTSFWIEYHLWGLKPLGYHLDNVLLQALAAVLLWLVLRRLSVPGAWLAAAVFAIHPLQVESVAWLAERKNTLSGVFFFAAMLAYLRYAGIGEGKRDGYFTALGLFACALLGKTSTVVLPVVLLILLWWKQERISLRDLLDLAPFFVLSAVAGWTTHWVEQNHVGATGEAWNLPFASRLIVAGRVIAFYAGKLFWPARLIHIYPKWQIDPGDLRQYAFALMAVVVPIVLWMLRRRIGKAPLVAVLFFEVALGPTLGFINVYFMRYSYTPHHFQYLACAGLIALATGLITILASKARVLSLALPIIILTLLGVSSWRQVSIFRNEETLWSDTIAKNPSAWMGYNNLGVLASHEGRYDEALAEYEHVIKLDPDFPDVYVNMAVAYAAKGEIQKATELSRKAIQLAPNDANAHYCLAELLRNQGQYEEAIAHYETALKISPGMEKARAGLELITQP